MRCGFDFDIATSSRVRDVPPVKATAASQFLKRFAVHCRLHPRAVILPVRWRRPSRCWRVQRHGAGRFAIFDNNFPRQPDHLMTGVFAPTSMLPVVFSRDRRHDGATMWDKASYISQLPSLLHHQKMQLLRHSVRRAPAVGRLMLSHHQLLFRPACPCASHPGPRSPACPSPAAPPPSAREPAQPWFQRFEKAFTSS